MYNNIYDIKNKRYVSTNSRKGKIILKNYIKMLKGGAMRQYNNPENLNIVVEKIRQNSELDHLSIDLLENMIKYVYRQYINIINNNDINWVETVKNRLLLYVRHGIPLNTYVEEWVYFNNENKDNEENENKDNMRRRERDWE